MPNIKRYKINPYLFLLAKEMVIYDFEGIKGGNTKHGIAGFIYDRYKSNKFRDTTYSTYTKKHGAGAKKCELDPIAAKRANSIYASLLKPEDFVFSDEMLDRFVQEIAVLGHFNSWKEFVFAFQDDPGAVAAKKYYMHCNYSALYEVQKDNLLAWVKQRILDLHFELSNVNTEENYIVIKHTKEFVIRTLSRWEQKELEIVPLKENAKFVKTLREYSIHQPNSVFIYKDNYEVRAAICIQQIPLSSFSDIISGKPDVFFQKKDPRNGNLNYFFISQFLCNDEKIMFTMLQNIGKMIETWTSRRDNIFICGYAKAGSDLKSPQSIYLNHFNFADKTIYSNRLGRIEHHLFYMMSVKELQAQLDIYAKRIGHNKQ